MSDPAGWSEVGPNFITRPYRGVSVQEVGWALDEAALREHLIGRRVYRRTEFLVLVHGEQRTLVQIAREAVAADPLFVPVADLRVLAGPGDVGFVDDESVDTGNASQMAAAARTAGAARVTVVQGRHQHVNFIVAPAPVRVRVVEVIPPEPPKLLEMARQVIDFDEDLPPVELDLVAIDLRALAREGAATHHLFPCRSGGLEGVAAAGETVHFLDAGPPEALPWTLVGCERSRQIHEALYGADPADRIDLCPRRLATPDGGRTLLKCCLLERGIEQDGDALVVPWGASLEEVRQALHRITG